jgi:hypothetical protein
LTQEEELRVRAAVNACIDPSRGTMVGMAFEAVYQLADALLDTRKGDDKNDGQPCWCPSPTYAARRTGDASGHTARCLKCRAALSVSATEKPAVQP